MQNNFRKLSIVTYPNPILEQESSLVSFPLDTETRELIANMWFTVKEQGIGLAAPQVGVNKQICIISLSQDQELLKEVKKYKLKQADFLMINPKIIWQSELQNLMIEGCLSFPGEYWKIWRPANISVEFYNEEGQKQILKNLKGWLARVIQHEVDHLNGKLFIKKGGIKLETRELKNFKFVD